MDLSIIIITHNSSSQVEKCLRSIDKHPPSREFETIVVDNASSDGTPSIVSEGSPRVILAANTENIGYSRGVNQGISLSSGAYILILNPDIEVREGSIDNLVDFMERTPDAGIAGAKLLYPDGKLQYSCRAFYTFRALFLRKTFIGKLFPRARALRDHLMTDFDHESERKVDWLIGACMIVRREAFENVGGMDERFFLYFEDTDWCYRMRHHGWGVYYVPGSVMIHHYERSSAKSVFRKPFLMHLLSLLRYYEKWNRLFYFFRRHRVALKSMVFVLADAVAVNAAFFGAYYLRGLLERMFVNDLYPLSWYAYYILFYNVLFFLTFLFGGLYRVRRETGAVLELSWIIRSVFAVFAILLGATYLTRIRIYSRAVLAGQAVFTVIAVYGLRRWIRKVHSFLVRASFDLKRVLIAGDRDEAIEFKTAVSSDKGSGIDIVGYIGDGEGSLGTAGELADIVERFKVQEVIVLPSCPDVVPFLVNSGSRMIQVRVVSPVARFLGKGVRVDRLGDRYMFSIERGAQYALLKVTARMIDIISALVLIPVSAVVRMVTGIYSAAGGGMGFSREERLGKGFSRLSWQRVSLKSGKEASDLAKPLLYVYLLAGRLSLVGTPALRASWTGEEMPWLGGFRPGITGRWRLEKGKDWKRALEDEIIALRTLSATDYFEILFRSIRISLSGGYPEWFFSDRGD